MGTVKWTSTFGARNLEILLEEAQDYKSDNPMLARKPDVLDPRAIRSLDLKNDPHTVKIGGVHCGANTLYMPLSC